MWDAGFILLPPEGVSCILFHNIAEARFVAARSIRCGSKTSIPREAVDFNTKNTVTSSFILSWEGDFRSLLFRLAGDELDGEVEVA